MPGSFRLPLVVIAASLLGLLLLLATLQYRWLGQISEGERDRMHAALATRTSEFAQDFDRELTRAFLLFQTDAAQSSGELAERLAVRYDRWQATARFPRLIKDVFVVSRADWSATLQRFNTATRVLEPTAWPASMSGWEQQFNVHADAAAGPKVVIARMASPIWESVPALVVPTAIVLVRTTNGLPNLQVAPQLSFVVLTLDAPYISGELLPALAAQHFRSGSGGFEYELAVVRLHDGSAPVYATSASFAPKPDTKADAAADLFQVRTQDFGPVAAEIRRFTTYTSVTRETGAAATRTERQEFEMRTPPPMSIMVDRRGDPAAAAALGAAAARIAVAGAPHWRLMVKHPAGSLEAAVNTARRRNLLISSSILGVLGASMALLILSTRRAQDLARRQMEFVAGVTHELRTPLAVIRSAGDNLADGVVQDATQIRTYGELVRTEGRRLSEMVEQILEFAGIESGRRHLRLRPVAIGPLLREVLSTSSSLIDEAGITLEVEVPESLPPVLGDEAAIRRVVQNLVGNAIKYGASGGWIGVRARAAGDEIQIAVADRGMGMPASEHARVFEPFYRTADVLAAQMQGAGLGLSLVKRIVDAHGGRVTLTSAPGQGSEFVVHVPIARAAGEESAANRGGLTAPDPHHT